MHVDILIDTGAILALLDASDIWHSRCVDAYTQLRLPLVTSEAVLTELFHLIHDARVPAEGAWQFLRSGVVVAPITNDELPHLHALMSKYSDRPMDFADATLVYLAGRESISTILTTDHDDFSTYRIEGARRFRIFPSTRP